MLSILLLLLLAFSLLSAACCSHCLCLCLRKCCCCWHSASMTVVVLHMWTRMHIPVLPPALLHLFALPVLRPACLTCPDCLAPSHPLTTVLMLQTAPKVVVIILLLLLLAFSLLSVACCSHCLCLCSRKCSCCWHSASMTCGRTAWTNSRRLWSRASVSASANANASANASATARANDYASASATASARTRARANANAKATTATTTTWNGKPKNGWERKRTLKHLNKHSNKRQNVAIIRAHLISFHEMYIWSVHKCKYSTTTATTSNANIPFHLKYTL